MATMMTKAAARWWAAEVAREDAANDNMDMAEWAMRWTKVAEMMAAKNWRDQEVAVRSMVAVARQANRVRAV